jgi:ATP-dependent helicase Lhr and Lhr-like helicase
MRDLPPLFANWFREQGWQLRTHQQAMLDAAAQNQDALLIAPTGGGKTLAGFLPSLIELAANPGQGLHTLYVSPLKALATDIARNLSKPIEDMQLDITAETRSGDTAPARRTRQKHLPPDILLTTPESLALLLSAEDSSRFFGKLRCVVVDEIHALAGTKRGDQLALCLSHLRILAPQMRATGLSATVAHPQAMLDYLGRGAKLIEAGSCVKPEIRLLLPETKIPWSGHMGVGAAQAVLKQISQARMSIVFVNTRAQAELMFQNIWKHNAETLPIGLHHGSLDITQRRRVEAAMGTMASCVPWSPLPRWTSA